ncbi:UNVERIFIED_ORG: DNA-binding LacI/PurR family transcriptional regulator [Microbispora rosea subsp. rosea]
MRVVTGRRVDGVILMEIRLEDDRVTRLRQSELPFAGIGRTSHPEDMTWVDVDYETLTSQCVHHLADLGHRNIALVDRSAELVAAGYGPGHRAQAGFTRAVAQRDVHGVHACCADDAQAGPSCVGQLLANIPN